MFPLPQNLTDAWCARHQRLNLDPGEAVRRVRAATAGRPLRRALLDFSVLELVFNVALFAPLGWFGRRIGEWRALTTLVVGFLVSLAIEATQYMGVWGAFRCAYRLADVIDLVTNTTGTLVGIVLALLFPKLFPTSDELEAQVDRARAVDKGRRWLGQVLDAAYFLVALAVVGFALALTYRYLGWATRDEPGPLLGAVMIAADALALVFAVLSYSGDGSSLGQRTTYLRPVRAGRPPSAWRRLARPFVVLVPVAVLVFGQPTWTGRVVGVIWGLVGVLSILVTRAGLSGTVTGTAYADSRDPAFTGAPRPPATIDA